MATRVDADARDIGCSLTQNLQELSVATADVIHGSTVQLESPAHEPYKIALIGFEHRRLDVIVVVLVISHEVWIEVAVVREATGTAGCQSEPANRCTTRFIPRRIRDVVEHGKRFPPDRHLGRSAAYRTDLHHPSLPGFRPTEW